MSSKPTARFTINLLGEDHPRSLFSVYERGNGEISLGLTSPYYDAPIDTPIQEAIDRMGTFPKVREHRYSIHPSPGSKVGVNTIKQTRIAEGGKPVHSYHLTKAIKSGSNFAFLFCRRCSTMLTGTVPKTKGKTEISLGEYDTRIFSLIYAVLVSARENEYFVPGHEPYKQINVTHFLCKNLRITVLWTFTNTPSHNSFRTYHLDTENLESQERLMLGYTPIECADELLKQAAILSEMLFDILEVEHGKETADFYRDIRGLFSIGANYYLPFQNHRDKVFKLADFRAAVRKARKDREQRK